MEPRKPEITGAVFPEGEASPDRDITDRKRTEAKIVEQHALMRITLDSIADAVITTDEWGICGQKPAVTGWSNGSTATSACTNDGVRCGG